MRYTGPMLASGSLATEWAAGLGLVPVELFGAGFVDRAPPGDHFALLDGARASFLLSVGPGADAIGEVRSWSWSSRVQHHIAIDPHRERAVYTRWDRDEPIRLRYPRRERDRLKLLASLERAPAPRADDVVLHTLIAYRQLAHTLGTPLDAVRTLNGILAGAMEVQKGRLARDALLGAETPSDVGALLSEEWRAATGIDAVRAAGARVRLGGIVEHVLAGHTLAGLEFNSHLFLRHAASQLYQDAHNETRLAPQLALPGLARVPEGLLAGTRDTHFTPIALARLIAQRAVAAIQRPSSSTLRVLDPACGSGVFLQEAVRELLARRFTGVVDLRGVDISPAACAITRFVLEPVVADAAAHGVTVQLRIEEADATTADWDEADLILMNPPFQSWQAMEPARQARVKEILGELDHGRPDVAMAFAWRAVNALSPGGALGTVLPAPLLETAAGLSWREAIAKLCTFDAIGRLASPTFFRGALVEPSFVVCRRDDHATVAEADVLFLVADAGSEDLAVRAARRASVEADVQLALPDDPGVDVYRARWKPTNESWTPRPRALHALADEVERRGHPLARDLFDILQGARTGHNKAFLLDEEAVASLPEGERVYFRPAIVNASIFDGQLSARSFVFYPYNRDGTMLADEATVQDAVPTYFARYLEPNREELAHRAGIDPDSWWLLTRGRTWQHEAFPKLVSTYFGDQGSFALDPDGSFVVVQGFAWEWRGASDDDDPDSAVPRDNATFVRGNLGLAYLALLNSACFARVLETVAPRVAGGQFNLSRRFAERARVPNLAAPDRASSHAIAALVRLGRRILANGLASCASEVDEAAALAYGVSLALVNRSR